MWKTDFVKLNNLQIGHKHTIKFYYLGNGTVKLDSRKKQVISKDCGCFNGVYTPNDKVLTVTYVPKPLPNKVKAKGETSYQSTKSIKITMVEDEKDRQYTLKWSSTNHKRLQRLMP